MTPREEAKKRKEAHYAEVTGSRRDILVYTTEPFPESYTFAGPVSAVLYASTSGKDTDWFVRLAEVDDKGKVLPLVTGKVRARFRNSASRPELLEPNKVYEYRLDLWQTGLTVKPGRRLVVSQFGRARLPPSRAASARREPRPPNRGVN